MQLISLRAIALTLSVLVLASFSACGSGEAEPPSAEAAGSGTPDGSSPGDASDAEMADVMGGVVGSDLPLEMRVFTLQRLAELDSEVSVGPIVRAFADPEPAVVLAAVEALPPTDDQAALEGLRKLGSHPDPQVRSAASRKLASLE